MLKFENTIDDEVLMKKVEISDRVPDKIYKFGDDIDIIDHSLGKRNQECLIEVVIGRKLGDNEEIRI